MTATDFDAAAHVPAHPRGPLSRERVMARSAAIERAKKANRQARKPKRVTCPTPDCASHVVPYDGDGNGNVTVFRCITCKVNFPAGGAS